MIWDELFETMLKEVGASSGFGFTKTRGGYILSDEDLTVGFTTFVTRQGKLKILMSVGKKIIEIGDYTTLELQGKNAKAKKAILAKLDALQ